MATAAVPGVRRTGQFGTDEVRGSFREGVYYSDPNGETPLYAISERNAKGEKLPYYHHKWWAQRRPMQGGSFTAGQVYTTADVVSGPAYTDAASPAGTVVYVKVSAAIAKQIRKGHQVKLSKTADYRYTKAFECVGRTVNGSNSYVALALQETGSATYGLLGCNHIQVIGNMNPQFGARPEGVKYDPTQFETKTQIFRTPFGMSRTAQEMALRTGKPWARDKKMAGILHRQEIERAFIDGIMTESVGDNGDILTTLRGLNEYAITYADSANIACYNTDETYAGLEWTADGGGMTWIENYLENYGIWGIMEPMAVGGIKAVNAFDRLARAHSTYNISEGENAFGTKIRKFMGAAVTLQLKVHPMMSLDPVWNYGLILFDPKKMHYAYITDTMVNSQKSEDQREDGLDGRIEELLTECTFEYEDPRQIGILHGLGLNNTLE